MTQIFWASFFVFLIQVFQAPVAEGRSMKEVRRSVEVIPGQSLGDIKIGDSREDLLKKGFVPDQIRDPALYLVRPPLMARLSDNKVVQIWSDEKGLKSLTLKGRPFPKNLDQKSLRKFFSGCGPEIKGSGGVIFYCENKGIEITYSFNSGSAEPGFSVTSVTVADSVVGGKSPSK